MSSIEMVISVLLVSSSFSLGLLYNLWRDRVYIREHAYLQPIYPHFLAKHEWSFAFVMRLSDRVLLATGIMLALGGPSGCIILYLFCEEVKQLRETLYETLNIHGYTI